MKCAIFYGSGEVYVGEGLDAYPLDVQAVVYDDPSDTNRTVGRVVLKGWDYYLLEGESWVGVNGEADFADHVIHCQPTKVLKGRMIPRDRWQAIIDRAAAFPGFKERCGFNKGFEGR